MQAFFGMSAPQHLIQKVVGEGIGKIKSFKKTTILLNFTENERNIYIVFVAVVYSVIFEHIIKARTK